MAAQRAGGHAAASAARLAPGAALPCRTLRWRNSLASEPSSLARRNGGSLEHLGRRACPPGSASGRA
eukprot:10003680-Alexandrium_andersonii.AAC.1